MGKSTVALNVALALAEFGESVGIVDADAYGPDIPLMVNMKRTESAQYWSLGSTKEQSIEPMEAFGLKIVSTGFIVGESHPVAWASSLVDRMLWQFVHETSWGELDWLFIDLPPGTADLQQGIAQAVPLSGAVVVVTPQDVAHLDAKKVVTMYRQGGVRIIGGIENMSGMSCPHCKEVIDVLPRVRDERSIWAMDVARLGVIPMDPAVAFGGDEGKPVMVSDPGSASAEAFRVVARAIASELSA